MPSIPVYETSTTSICAATNGVFLRTCLHRDTAYTSQKQKQVQTCEGCCSLETTVASDPDQQDVAQSRRNKLRRGAQSALVALALPTASWTVACNLLPSAESSTAAPTPELPLEKNTIHIGHVISLSGANNAAGVAISRGPVYDMWGESLYYSSLQHLEQAIVEAGTLDQAVIRDLLATRTYDAALG
jgi:hypothetical protein